MKKLISILFLSFLFHTVSFSQLNFLEKNEGVKQITKYQIRWKKGEVKQKVFTKIFNKKGEIETIYNKSDRYKFLREDDKVIEIYSKTGRDTCSGAREYLIHHEKNRIVIKKRKHELTHIDTVVNQCFPIEDMDIAAMGIKSYNSLFKGIDWEIKEEGFDEIIIIDYSNPNPKTNKEYSVYFYYKDKNEKMVLFQIETILMNGNEDILKRYYTVEKYKNEKSIILDTQLIFDKNDSFLKEIVSNTIIQPTGESFNKYEYEFDEKNNWIKKYWNSPDGKKLIAEREIEYY